MYTWAKESDFGTNLGSGLYKDTHLAELWTKALTTGKPVMVDMRPYAPSNDAPAMFVGERVEVDGEVLGVFALQISLDEINAVMQTRAGMGTTGETYLVGEDKLMRSDSYLDPVNHSVDASLVGTVAKNGVDTVAVDAALRGESGAEVIIDYNGNPVLSAWGRIEFGGFDWAILAEIDEAEVNAPVRSLVILIIFAAAGIVVVCIVVAILFARSISKPLGTVTGVAERIAAGDFTIEDFSMKRKDEIGALARAFGVMVEALRLKAGAIERIASGDLTEEITKASDIDRLGDSLLAMNQNLNDVLSQVREAVDQVSSGSNQVSQASQSLSQGATEQASSLEEIGSSLSQISGQSKQNAENASEANTLAKKAVEDAEDGNVKMQELMNAMERIDTSSDQISRVVKVIDDIAFQINLLALNANVEAARAGKYGKGFAVVAEEVRNLAVRSAAAVSETNQMVEETVHNIEDGARAAELTAAQLTDIVEGAGKVAEYLGEIALASNEQAQGVEQITSGLDQIDQVTQSNTASAEESASAAEELAAQSQQLQAMIEKFRLRETVSGNGNHQRTGGGASYPAVVTPDAGIALDGHNFGEF